MKTTARTARPFATALTLVLVCAAVLARAEGKVTCFAGIPPVAGLVERVGGDRVVVRVLIPEGEDPHSYAPTPRTMTRLTGSRVLFAVGLPAERRIVTKVRDVAGKLEVVWLDEGIDKRQITPHGGPSSKDHRSERAEEADDGHSARHPHGHHHHHHEEIGLDPHIWMSPLNAIKMAGTIADALAEADPERAEVYGENLERVEAEIRRVHERIGETLEPFRGSSFYVFHPAFGYFGDAYGLHQKAVEVSGRRPGPRELRQLIQDAKDEGVRILFVQPQFDASSARAVAKAINGSVVRLNPLERDLVGNFTKVVNAIRDALGDE